jgi:hypothetical protein
LVRHAAQLGRSGDANELRDNALFSRDSGIPDLAINAMPFDPVPDIVSRVA